MTATATANGTKTATKTEARQTDGRPPLWPNDMRLEVIGLTGDFESGKTLFGLTIDPGPRTLVYDMEKSCGIYKSLGFDRIDFTAVMLKEYPRGYQPMDLYTTWRDHMRATPAGKFTVMMVDPISELEEGIVEYVRKHPSEFGYTPAQFMKAEALVWGCVKNHWKQLLSEAAARVETFVFTSHLRMEFAGGRPTGKKIAKGKETLMELASLYLETERLPDKKGAKPQVPSARVLKSRLANFHLDPATGELKPVSVLPPRLPVATPKAIRDYILNPPDYEHLKAGERAVEKEMTEDERLTAKIHLAELENNTESIRASREGRAPSTRSGKPQQSLAPETETESAADTAPAQAQEVAESDAAPRVNRDTRHQINRLRSILEIPDDAWAAAMDRRGVRDVIEMDQATADEFLLSLQQLRKEMDLGEVVAAGERQGAATN